MKILSFPESKDLKTLETVFKEIRDTRLTNGHLFKIKKYVFIAYDEGNSTSFCASAMDEVTFAGLLEVAKGMQLMSKNGK